KLVIPLEEASAQLKAFEDPSVKIKPAEQKSIADASRTLKEQIAGQKSKIEEFKKRLEQLYAERFELMSLSTQAKSSEKEVSLAKLDRDITQLETNLKSELTKNVTLQHETETFLKSAESALVSDKDRTTLKQKVEQEKANISFGN
ncbi:MAG TPA: hypothetical protein VHA13_00965, partial [Gammaproteobacteria bacterium]|nr:hypothetical protein [Gammaproteobacteria bacterium]